jgi:hypothetical protein
MKQSTTNNNKNENMKMRKKLIIALVLGACVGTQAFAQVKEDVITFSLTGQKQVSVSTSATAQNAGLWTQEPHYYKTGTQKVTDQDIIKFIAYVKHGNANYYSTRAKLVLVQGELSGFFNITPELGDSIPHNHNIDGSGNPDGVDGLFYTSDTDPSTDIPNSTDSAFVTMANGHHIQLNNAGSSTLYPVGHLQPWGQIFIKDTGKSGYSVITPLCENVTYYFAMSVEECYDCFYMNSFVSDATFTRKNAQHSGPVCCGTDSTLVGKGKDRYYLTLSFDNTINNPYLNPAANLWIVTEVGIKMNSVTFGLNGDGLVPDQLNPGNTEAEGYFDPINHTWSPRALPYEARFTLNGILTYTWNLQFVNSADIAPDFIGTASYPASGYGFVSLFCQLFTGTATFTEKVVRTACCLDNDYWYDTFGGWYGPGAEYYETLDEVGIAIMDQTKYSAGAYDQGFGASPINVGPSLTYHHNFDGNYPWAQNLWGAGWPTPAVITPWELNGTWPAFYGWNEYDRNQGL